MKVTKLWCVCDPKPVSTLDDILFELELSKGLGNYIRGSGAEYDRENHAFYDTETEARKDAEKRMAKKPSYQR